MSSFDPWSHYDIPHVSPSACNRFMSSPALYLQEYVFKKRSPVGPAAHRGSACELGIVAGLLGGKSVEECQNIALTHFDRLTALSPDPRKEKERAAVPKIVVKGIEELKGYGPPSSTQGEVRWVVEGLGVPFKGFYDMQWANHGIITDLKTTLALPSKISSSHARQVALYNAAAGDNYSARVTYVTPAKSATYQLENARDHMKSLERCALTIQRFLSLSRDKHELAALVIPDVDGFYYSDQQARQIAYEIWGI